MSRDLRAGGVDRRRRCVGVPASIAVHLSSRYPGTSRYTGITTSSSRKEVLHIVQRNNSTKTSTAAMWCKPKVPDGMGPYPVPGWYRYRYPGRDPGVYPAGKPAVPGYPGRQAQSAFSDHCWYEIGLLRVLRLLGDRPSFDGWYPGYPGYPGTRYPGTGLGFLACTRCTSGYTIGSVACTLGYPGTVRPLCVRTQIGKRVQPYWYSKIRRSYHGSTVPGTAEESTL
eukprot:1922711-Rhodomonas_salina.1